MNESISAVELTRKNVASAFWNYEIEEELYVSRDGGTIVSTV